MKARAVAGDTERATTFLNDLQKWTGAATGRAGVPRKICGRCACAWKRSRVPNIR